MATKTPADIYRQQQLAAADHEKRIRQLERQVKALNELASKWQKQMRDAQRRARNL
jgi:flagellin-specific chaperone FliS